MENTSSLSQPPNPSPSPRSKPPIRIPFTPSPSLQNKGVKFSRMLDLLNETEDKIARLRNLMRQNSSGGNGNGGEDEGELD